MLTLVIIQDAFFSCRNQIDNSLQAMTKKKGIAIFFCKWLFCFLFSLVHCHRSVLQVEIIFFLADTSTEYMQATLFLVTYALPHKQQPRTLGLGIRLRAKKRFEYPSIIGTIGEMSYG